jgi:AcrR family transcriptional regulator
MALSPANPAVPAAKRPDKRVARTRDALLAAGYGLFAERGLHEVSVDEIIDKASISKQTFYNHFTDKFALARDIYLSIRARIEAEIAEINVGVADPAARVARGVCVYVRTALNDTDRIRFITRMLVQDIGVSDPANQGLIRDLEAGLAAGRFVVRTFENAAAFVLGATEPMLLSVVANRNAEAAVAMAQEFLTLIMRGLAVPPLEAELIASQAAHQIIR